MLRRNDKAVGGMSTVVVAILMVTLVAVVIVNALFDPAYSRAMSPMLPPFYPSGAMTATVYYYRMAADACASASVTVLAAQVFGFGTVTTNYAVASRTCTSVWKCANDDCTLNVDPIQFSFAVNSYAAYAASISWSIEFPAYSSGTALGGTTSDSSDRFLLAGQITPATNYALRGGLTSVIVSHIAVTVLIQPSGTQVVGSLAQLALLGTVFSANQTEFSTVPNEVGVIINIVPNAQTYAVSAPALSLTLVVGSCAAYVALLVGVVKVVMNLAERCFPKNRTSGFRQAWTALTLCVAPCRKRCGRSCDCDCGFAGGCGGCTRFWRSTPRTKTVAVVNDMPAQVSPISTTEMLERRESV